MRTSEYRGVLSHSFTLHSGAPCPAGLSATFVVSTASLSASTRSRVTRTQACARASHLQTRAVLNTRVKFAAPVCAPVLNNVVVIATRALFVLVPGPQAATPASLSISQQVFLGVGTTLGVVAMSLIHI